MKFAFLCKEKGSEGRGKVAIVGAGPAGLAAAGFLVCKGYDVEVFDKLPLPGGLMTFAIPSYRIRLEAVLEGVEDLKKNFGVQFHLSTKVICGKRHDEGDDFAKNEVRLSDLVSDFDAVLIATGTWQSRKMRIPGEDAEGVETALEYLFKVRAHEYGLMPEPPVPRRVIVVGGGLSAVDAAEVSLERGSEVVYLMYRRSIQQAPAGVYEIRRLIRKGVKWMELANPTRIITEGGRVKAVEAIRMRLGEPDASGRPRPEPIPGSEFVVEADAVIEAIGEYSTPPIGEGCSELGIEVDRRGRIVVDENFRTSHPKVFAAGDVVTGPSKIGDASLLGLRAAKAIHLTLSEGLTRL